MLQDEVEVGMENVLRCRSKDMFEQYDHEGKEL